VVSRSVFSTFRQASGFGPLHTSWISQRGVDVSANAAFDRKIQKAIAMNMRAMRDAPKSKMTDAVARAGQGIS
jgi:hypothetical protein